MSRRNTIQYKRTISEDLLTKIRPHEQRIIDITSRIHNLKVRLLNLWGDRRTVNTMDRHIICLEYLTKIRLFEQMNSELASTLNNLVTMARHMQYIKMKCLALNEAEKTFLMHGIDTSEYSASSNGKQDTDSDIKIVDHTKCEAESELDTEN